MRSSIALTSVFTAAIFNAALNGSSTGLAAAQRQSEKGPYILRSCDQFPATELDVAGTVTFLRNMDCKDPTVMHIEKSLVLRSHSVLDIKNIHFVVHNGATLTLRAPAMNIARDQGSTLPLFDVSGKLTFEATGSISGRMEGSAEDERGVVLVKDGGTVKTAQDIRYNADSVTVSMTAEPGENMGDSETQLFQLSHVLKNSLAAYQAKIKTAPDFDSSSTSYSSATTSSSSSPPASPESVDADDEDEPSFLSAYFDTQGGPGARQSAHVGHAPTDAGAPKREEDKLNNIISGADPDGITYRRSPGTSLTVIPIPTPTPRSSSFPTPISTLTPASPGTPHSSNSSPSPTHHRYPGSPSQPNRHDSSPSHSHGQNNSPPSAPTPTPSPSPSSSSPGGPQWESEHDRSGSRSDNVEASGPKLALRVGDVLDPPALSLSGKAMLWPAEDGAIMFLKIPDESPEVTGAEGTTRTDASTVMVAPDAGRLKRVFQARMTLRKEMREGSIAARGKGTWGAWGWVPWRRQHLRDVDRARGRLGQVEMTLDDRAGLEVSVDGTRVVSRSGPNKREWVNRFPWRRRKNESYELYVTEEGFEVQLEGKTVWGITADGDE